MALDVTGLQQSVAVIEEVLGKLTYQETILGLFEASTDALPDTIYKYRMLEGNAVLGDCCGDSDATLKPEEIEAYAACIASRLILCELDMAKMASNATGMRFGAGRESAGSLEELISMQQLASLAKVIDRLIWQGDTTLADGQLNKIDGLLKQADDATDAIDITINTGDAYSAILSIASAIPEDAFDRGGAIGIFVNQAMFNAFSLSLIARDNSYIPPTGDINRPNYNQRVSVPGFSNIFLINARGLVGTNRAIATPISNIHWLTNLESDHTTFDWDYNKWHERYKWYAKFVLGIFFKETDLVVNITIDPAVLTNRYSVDVTIVSPLDAGTGALAVTQTP